MARILALLAFLTGACGGGRAHPTEQDRRQRVERFQRAMAQSREGNRARAMRFAPRCPTGSRLNVEPEGSLGVEQTLACLRGDGALDGPLLLVSFEGGGRGVVLLVGRFRDGKLDGSWAWSDGAGRKLMEGWYEAGEPRGTWRQWSHGGRLLGTVTFHAGAARWVEWFDDGRRSVEGNCRDGLKDGEWTVWAPDGERVAVAHFQRGVPHGRWTVWQAGVVRSDGEYVRGRKDGAWRERYEAMRVEAPEYEDDAGHYRSMGHDTYLPAVRLEGRYAGGKRTGAWIAIDDRGQVRWRRSYEAGVPVLEAAERDERSERIDRWYRTRSAPQRSLGLALEPGAGGDRPSARRRLLWDLGR